VTPVLLDTGCIVALLDRSERHHEACKQALLDLTVPLVTCEAVIAEACWILRGIRGAADAVLRNVEEGVFGIPLPLVTASGSVRALLKKYSRVRMDLADACLVNMADELGTGRILTLDRDFRIYRWRKTRRFELLVELD
jgi:predicted nucleic acid-binding protein